MINFLILYVAPQPLNEDIVHPVSAFICADPYAIALNDISKSLTNELVTLTGIEYLETTVLYDDDLQRLTTEIHIHVVR